jgi:NhaP-type Na+/H+ or K+/H+ antiporter
MDASFLITLSIVLTVAAGIGAQVIADYLKLPGIVFLLLFGIGLGPSGLNWLRPAILGDGLETLVSLSVALILFEGGLSLGLRELGRVSGSLRNLVTIGTLITFVGGGMAAHWLGEFPWTIAFLYASLIVVTGPTVISPLLKQVQADRQVSTLLEGEGVLIDPVGAILAVLVLDVVLNGDADLVGLIGGLVLRLSLGVAIGGVGGWLMGWFIKKASFLSDDLKNLFVLAGVWSLFAIAQLLISESGLMATVAAGLVLRASSLPEERLLRRFKGQLTTLAVSVLFVLLAADLSIASIIALGWGSLATVAVLMFVVRPVNIWVCTWNSDLNWRQKLFAGWISPRGIVSASVSSLFSILLVERGVNGGDAIKALVFLTIVVTVIVQGLTAKPLAQLLQVQATGDRGALIVGSNPLSRLVAQLFQERGEFVVLIDTDAEACEAAERENIPVFLSSALDTDVLEEAGLSSIGTFVTMTSNGEVNAVLAQRAIEEFSPPRTLALLPKDSTKSAKATKVQQALKQDFPIKLWNQRLRDGAVKLGETTLREAGFAFQQAHIQQLIEVNELVPLLLQRSELLRIVPSQVTWLVGDRLIYLFYAPKPKLLQRLSGSKTLGLKLETIPEVEKVDIPTVVLEEYRNAQEETATSETERDASEDIQAAKKDQPGKEKPEKDRLKGGLKLKPPTIQPKNTQTPPSATPKSTTPAASPSPSQSSSSQSSPTPPSPNPPDETSV